ncbi:hypothetical protein LJC33_04420 [Eubacteriales bacterium OttesenSCG-928-N13]|nr:hypothetical protein [Eubacteriales bacterium OttesenSCG-928-N13]
MQDKKQEYRIGPGVSSLLMIFVSLCMTALGMLTLINAINDQSMTTRSKDAIHAYYDGAAVGQKELAQIDAQLKQARQTSSTVEEYEAAVHALKSDTFKLGVESGREGDYVLVDFSASTIEGREIFIQIEVPMILEGPRYAIVAHMLQSTDAWIPNDDLDLFTSVEEHENLADGITMADDDDEAEDEELSWGDDDEAEDEELSWGDDDEAEDEELSWDDDDEDADESGDEDTDEDE